MLQGSWESLVEVEPMPAPPAAPGRRLAVAAGALLALEWPGSPRSQPVCVGVARESLVGSSPRSHRRPCRGRGGCWRPLPAPGWPGPERPSSPRLHPVCAGVSESAGLSPARPHWDGRERSTRGGEADAGSGRRSEVRAASGFARVPDP